MRLRSPRLPRGVRIGHQYRQAGARGDLRGCAVVAGGPRDRHGEGSRGACTRWRRARAPDLGRDDGHARFGRREHPRCLQPRAGRPGRWRDPDRGPAADPGQGDGAPTGDGAGSTFRRCRPDRAARRA